MNTVVYSTEHSGYHMFENKNTPQRRCIDGKITGSNKCVGYCRYMGHPGFLTEKNRKEHDCLGKGCHYYVSKKRKEEPEASPFAVLRALYA